MASNRITLKDDSKPLAMSIIYFGKLKAVRPNDESFITVGDKQGIEEILRLEESSIPRFVNTGMLSGTRAPTEYLLVAGKLDDKKIYANMIVPMSGTTLRCLKEMTGYKMQNPLEDCVYDNADLHLYYDMGNRKMFDFFINNRKPPPLDWCQNKINIDFKREALKEFYDLINTVQSTEHLQ